MGPLIVTTPLKFRGKLIRKYNEEIKNILIENDDVDILFDFNILDIKRGFYIPEIEQVVFGYDYKGKLVRVWTDAETASFIDYCVNIKYTNPCLIRQYGLNFILNSFNEAFSLLVDTNTENLVLEKDFAEFEF